MKNFLRLWPLWLFAFLFATYMALVSFIDSSMLTEVFNLKESMVGLLYSIGSLCALLFVLGLPKIFNHSVAVKNTLAIAALTSTLAFTGLIFAPKTALFATLFFIMYLMGNACMFYLADIVITHHSTPENTGTMRGLYLTMMNIAWVAMPFISGSIIQQTEKYLVVYAIAAAVIATAGIVAFFFFDPFVPQTSHRQVHPQMNLGTFFKNRDLRMIFNTNMILQTFYVVMVIYTPIYLSQNVGLSWGQIGIIFTIMLTAFIIFQYPLGYIADRYLGEKEILTAGIIIMSLTTLAMAYMPEGISWIWWIGLMFGTRVGASMTEAMNETYFFKHVTSNDVAYMSYYRNTRPLAYVVAPIIVSFLIGTFHLDNQHIFIALGITIALGLFWSLRLKDTK